MSSTTPNTRSALALNPLAAAIALALALPAAAQDDDTRGLEEIVVTAQKRVENLQEVPLSVATISGDKLESAGVENLGDLTAHMPNIHFTETGLSTQVRVRGIGSDNSQGMEQSVGMYIDGIYYGRAQLFRIPMMDMERAELLRGPQSTLLGKNSIAGALNLTTARPQNDLAAKLSIGQEVEFNGTEINAMANTPVGQAAAVRLAVRRLTEDGYMTNTYLDTEQPEKEENSVRLSGIWTASENLELYAKAEQHTFETTGRPIEITYDVPLSEGGLTYNEYLHVLSLPGLDAAQNYERQADQEEYSDNEVNNFTFKVDYDWAEHTITAVSGWLDFNYEELCDCDFVAAEIVPVRLQEDYEQFSQEIRIASPVGKRYEWIAGAYYQNYDQTFEDSIDLAETNFLTSTYPVLKGTAMKRDFAQSSDAWAIFGRVTWNLNDALHLTLGARYTEESKDATKSMNVVSLDDGSIVNDPVIGITYMGAFLAENEQATLLPNPDLPPSEWEPLRHSGHNVSGERDESAFTPLLNLEWDLSDDMMLYSSYTTGFKAGGFDPRSNRVGRFDNRAVNPNAAPPPEDEGDPLQNFEFEKEQATAVEIGMKNTLGDGRAELNVALYHTDYDDLQISQFDGGVGFNVGNAKKTLVQGIEIDGRWLIAEHLTAYYGFAWLDTEYKDFKNGNCYAGQTPDTDTDGDGFNETCDYTGKRGVYTPEFTGNLTLDYYRPLTDKLTFVSALDWQYVDGHQVHVNLDPAGEIDAYNLLALRVGIEGEHWGLAVLGKNLLDEHIVSYSGNAPLSDSQFNTNTHYSFIRKPRTITLEATLHF
ncbi:TonB-dependent receptor [Teredinibacter turnerae]|uniref:TonB-dependent receptor n=1 Tax=Teredinibacter turnerae TaxID=2426 RepID=UPI00036FF5A2|nr:TonB-dependent receptor [Teredinibacter turnerae]